MEIDLQRWTRLCDEIDHLRAVGATINQQQFDLQRRRRDAANNLATVERHRRLEFGERPAPEETAETATQKGPCSQCREEPCGSPQGNTGRC